ncbi:MAG: phospho-sugar mutase [Eubacteriales bacterium]|nr:phospho-sugar mutase [Eubacteriales bacterium]
MTRELWANDPFFDEETRRICKNLSEQEAKELFSGTLHFGTGGLRAKMNVGTNRINRYTVGLATQALSQLLLDKYGKDLCSTRGVAIGYDTRLNSRQLAYSAAQILTANGIKAYLSEDPCSTPLLGFSVMHFACLAGIVLTASHNPKEYNGYKVYDEEGCQLVPKKAQQVAQYMQEIKDVRTLNFSTDESLLTYFDATKDFTNAVLRQQRLFDDNAKKNLSIVYTPLHGTGLKPVCEVLKKAGFVNVHTVEEQAVQDGNFPSVPTPNPEDHRALKMGVNLANQTGADIVLGTDPDADRIGVAVLHKGEYLFLSGNDIGALLVDYLLSKLPSESKSHTAVISTVVTGELGKKIAKQYGAAFFETLTGFKYIGEKISQFEKAKKQNDSLKNFDFLIGYEESYGYLAGEHVKDKDASVAALLICEMAAELKTQGKTLKDKLNALHKKYGFELNELVTFSLEGENAVQIMQNKLQKLRQQDAPFNGILKTLDFLNDINQNEGFGLYPKENLLKYIFSDGSWLALRPSGTEPKLKAYFCITGKDHAKAQEKLEELKKQVQKIFS